MSGRSKRANRGSKMAELIENARAEDEAAVADAPAGIIVFLRLYLHNFLNLLLHLLPQSLKLLYISISYTLKHLNLLNSFTSQSLKLLYISISFTSQSLILLYISTSQPLNLLNLSTSQPLNLILSTSQP